MNTQPLSLYIQDNNKSIREWIIYVTDGVIVIEHGQLGGSMQEKLEYVDEGKAGRSINEQILSRVASRISKQRDKGYVNSLEKASAGKPTNALGLTKPMLAQRFDKVKNIDLVESYTQMKYNGHRCLVTCVDVEIIAYSRNGKLITSIDHILRDIDIEEGEILDGELYCHGVALQTISSWVKRSQAHTSKLRYMVYDTIIDKPYSERLERLSSLNLIGSSELVPTIKTSEIESIKDRLVEVISEGFEGLIIRQGRQGYEDGKRSTSLVKIKKCFDDEFKVIDIHESIDGWGILECIIEEQEGLTSGKTFRVSAPGTIPNKEKILQNREVYVDKYISVEYFEITAGGIPFHPVATYFRDKDSE